MHYELKWIKNEYKSLLNLSSIRFYVFITVIKLVTQQT